MPAKSTGRLTASQKILETNGVVHSILVTTDSTNKATAALIATPQDAGDYLLTSAGLTIGSSLPNVASIAFDYLINGTLYSKAAVAAGTAPGNDVVPQNKYGAVALDIGADGTIDAIEAAANATGYNTAALAIADIAAVAADHVRMGYITAIKTDGTFTFGTTNLNAANSTVSYTSSAIITNTQLGKWAVPGASEYGGRNWTEPVEFQNGLLLSISGTGAAAYVEYN